MRPVVIGGGVAGATAALLLARAGRQPVLLEREAGAHDKVCGEFVSGEAARLLGALGLDVAGLRGGEIGRVRLVHGRRIAEAPLPFTAWGLSRRRLDAALLDLAARDGAAVRRGVAVRRLGQGEIGLADGSMRAEEIFLATGKHDLRGAGRDGRSAKLVGLKLHLRLAPAQARAIAGVVELHLVRGGYAGLLAIEDGIANLCAIVPAARFGGAARSAAALLDALGTAAPGLGARLAGAAPMSPKPLAVARVPYGYRHRPAPGDPPGLYRLGDQAAVIPSLTGDGMAIALHSASLAASSRDSSAYHDRLGRNLGPPLRLADGLHAAFRLWPGAAVAVASAFPALVGAGARWTRVPERALAAGENGGCLAPAW